MLPNAKRMNLNVSMLPISDLRKRFWMSLGRNIIGKIDKVHVQRGIVFSAFLPSGKLC